MKQYMMAMPDEATLKQYWGSAEAYLEEQRRTATYDMEANQVAAEIDRSNSSLVNVSAIKTRKGGLHLPFGLKNFRHA